MPLMRVAIYARLSRNRDGESTSIERQTTACEGRLEDGWSVIDTFIDDDVSAYSGKVRPAFEALLRDIGAGRFDVVLSYALDRLGRRPKDIERLLETGIRFITLRDGLDSSTASSELFIRILSAVAKMESDNTSARIRLKHDELRRKGEWSGGRNPYGWRAGQADNIRSGAEALLKGTSLQKIATEWGRDATFVRRTLLSPRMVGRRADDGGLSVEAGMPAILDEETWRKVCVLLTDPKRRAAAGGNRKKHLLAGLLTCGKCGRTLITHTKIGAKTSLQRRYQCIKVRGGCGTVSINASPVEALVKDQWVSFTSSDTFRGWMEEVIAGTERAKEDREAITSALESDRERLYALMDMFTSSTITREEWERGRAALIERIEAAEKFLTDEAAPFDPESKKWALSGDPDLALGLWDAASTDERRRELADAFSAITILPAKGRGRRFDPERVVLTTAT